MVFCYKIITDTPRRSGSVSPRRLSPDRKLLNVSSSCQLDTRAYDNDSVIDCIPEREWRLLAAVAKKREEDVEREELADQFRKLWEKEKMERELVEAETTYQFKKYLNQKRAQERCWQEYKRLQMSTKQQMRRGHLINCIRDKDKRSQELLAWVGDQKARVLINRSLEEDARMILAADRRVRQGEADQWRRCLEAAQTQKKARDAGRKRNALLRESAKRLAISNTLNLWETSQLRQEVSALEAVKRAHHAARAALTEARSASLARERENRQRRARRMAVITAQMREDIKLGRVMMYH